MGTAKNTYTSLNYTSSELSAFVVCIDMFIISLKNGKLIHFTPDDVSDFHDWLVCQGVREVEQAGTGENVSMPKSSEGLFERVIKFLKQ